MSLAVPQDLTVDGAGLSVGIVAARYNPTLVDALLHQVFEQLRAAGVKEKKIRVYRVPGSNELPSAAQWLATAAKPDVIVALGVIIRGDTKHYELVAEASAQGLMRVALDTRIAVRVHQMWEAGLLDEVRRLDVDGLREGRTASKALGYSQVLAHLDGLLSAEQAIEDTITATRRFARRQESWFRPDPRIHWLGYDDPQRIERALNIIGSA